MKFIPSCVTFFSKSSGENGIKLCQYLRKLQTVGSFFMAHGVEEFNISTPSLVFLALFIQARIWTKLPLQTITGAIPKNLKLE